MKSGALRRALGLTLLYIGGFVLLVVLQFSRGPGFSERFGRLAVTASFPKAERAGGGQAPEEVKFDFAGLSLAVSARSPAKLVGADGSIRNIGPRSIEKRKDGVRVLLEGGVELRASSAAGERYSLAARAPAGTRALRLAYTLSGRARLAAAAGSQSLESAGSTFALTLASSALDPASGYLVLRADEASGELGELALARKEAAPAKPGKPAAGERLAAQAPKDPAAFKAEIDAWRDKAWSGLASSRYDPERLAWRGGAEGQALPAESRFSERALVAYLAESLLRGSYTEALQRMRPARERWPAELGYLSAPYLGGLVKKMEALEAADLAESKRIAQLVQEKSPDLFMKEGLVHFLLDRSAPPLSSEALAFAATLDPAKLTLRQAVGLLGCLVESRSYLKDEENPFRALGASADRVAASVRAASGGLYLVGEEDGSVDLRLSLLAGQYLAAYGAAEGKEALLGLGQGLVEGYLGLCDERGAAPAKLLLREGAVDQRTGALLPEEAYPIVASNPYYPREVSFYREVGPGVWAWTCAPSLTVAAAADRYAFAATFPEGRSHHLTFYGIKSFANIQLYDIDYSPDSEFEIYDASGYLYRPQNRALYMKMKHKKESESIKLFF